MRAGNRISGVLIAGAGVLTLLLAAAGTVITR